MLPIFSVMGAYDNIVTLGIAPDDAASLSGLQLIQAPGITIKTLNNTANETYIKGVTLAMQKKALALVQFQNDFIGALQTNRVLTDINEPVYDTCVFNSASNIGASAAERGVSVWRNTAYRGSLRSVIIKTIQCYPLTSGNGTINIDDGQKVQSINVTFVANQVNTYSVTPIVLPSTSFGFKITIDAPDISFASARVICGEGCNGSIPNPCGHAKGWDGTGYQKYEGYGVNVQFYCHCDYTRIITDMANSFTGELIWLKWQYNIFDEQYKTDRFNFWCVYNREDIPKVILPDLANQYAQKWNEMMAGLFNILKTYNDDCLNCRGIRWRTNI